MVLWVGASVDEQVERIMKKPQQETIVPLRTPLFRGERRLRIALVGIPNVARVRYSRQYRVLKSIPVN